METSGTRFPVSHKQSSMEIKGIKTDIVICRHDDHFLDGAMGFVLFPSLMLETDFKVIATQIGAMGTMLQARKEEGMAINPTFSVSTVFGKRDEPMLVACARQLIEQISLSGSYKPLLISLGLKDHSVEMMKGIVTAVSENRLW